MLDQSQIQDSDLDRYFAIVQRIGSLQHRIQTFLQSFEFYVFVHVIEPALKTIKAFLHSKETFSLCKLKSRLSQMFDFIWKNLFFDEASSAIFDLIMKTYQNALDFVKIAESFENFMVYSQNWSEDLENCDLMVLKVRVEFSKAVEVLFKVIEGYKQKGLEIPCELNSCQAHHLLGPQLGKALIIVG